MKITDVRLTKLSSDSKVIAIGSITFDKCFVVDGIKVLTGNNGLWVSMPSRKTTDGEYKDIAFPTTKEFRQEINEAVISKRDELEKYMPDDLPDNELPF